MIDRNDEVISQTVNNGTIAFASEIPHNLNVSIMIKYSGSSGSTKIQISNTGDGTDWQDYPDSQNSFSAGSGTLYYSVSNYNYRYLNISCTASGTVTFNVRLTLKRDSNLG